MKYNVGDRVRIKSIDWYNENKDEDGDVPCGDYDFVSYMSVFCGKILTIDVDFEDETYLMKEDNDGFVFTNEMIEGLVEEETKPKFKVGDKIKLKSTLLNDMFGVIGYESEGYRITNISNGLTYFMSYSIEHYYELVEEEVGLVDNLSSRWVNEFSLPEGYIFKDENGNVINAMKIVLEKKTGYPKTYVECCELLSLGEDGRLYTKGYKASLIQDFRKLLICRDAYWKIAGEKMELTKSWEPNWEDENQEKYIIGSWLGTIQCLEENFVSHPLAFPTAEMRDAFKENFKELVEQCKELL